jgi:hypothetical protein
MTSPSVGLVAKFKVERLTPSSRGIDHGHCQYFVLDITHDPYARSAALAYADSCESEYPMLATDLRLIAAREAWRDNTPVEKPVPPAVLKILEDYPHASACGLFLSAAGTTDYVCSCWKAALCLAFGI